MDRLVVYLNGVRGLSVVDALIDAGNCIVLTVVPANGGNEVAERCRQHGLEVLSAADINAQEIIASIRGREPRLGIIAGYSQIFRAPLIDLPELGTINLHAGRLPQYRGGSPLNWQILNGETEAGISVIRVDSSIDGGPILAERRLTIGPDDDIAILHDRANEVFPVMVCDVVAGLDRGRAPAQAQDEAKAVYWHQRNEEDGWIDWQTMDAVEIHNLVRAITRPYPGAFTYRGVRRIRIWRTRLPQRIIRGVPGRVCYIEKVGPYLMCRDRAILLEDYTIEGENKSRLHTGERLSREGFA